MSKRVLGRGLKALIEETTVERRIRDVDIDLIAPNPDQPREKFSSDSLKELVESIKSHGILQPILVRSKDSRYQIIAGERRWRAAGLASLKRVPVIIVDAIDSEMLEIALIENLQREDLNPIEEAKAYKTLINKMGLSQEEVSKRVGKERATITNCIRLLQLSPKIQQLLIDGRINTGHAKVLLSCREEFEREKILQALLSDRLTVRQVERLSKKKEVTRIKSKDPNVVKAEDTLSRTLSAKVSIRQSGRGGFIEIRFSNGEELSRIYDLILRGGHR